MCVCPCTDCRLNAHHTGTPLAGLCLPHVPVSRLRPGFAQTLKYRRLIDRSLSFCSIPRTTDRFSGLFSIARYRRPDNLAAQSGLTDASVAFRQEAAAFSTASASNAGGVKRGSVHILRTSEPSAATTRKGRKTHTRFPPTAKPLGFRCVQRSLCRTCTGAPAESSGTAAATAISL